MVVNGGAGKEDIFVVLNGRLIPQLDPIQHSPTQISVLVIEASGSAAAIGALYRINSCLRDGCSSLRSITMPENVAMGGDEVIDPAQLRKLYDERYRMATASPMFFKQPPGSRREP